MMINKPKLLFLVAEDWYFCSHRLQLAIAAREAGYEVSVVTRVSQHENVIRAAGLGLVPLQRMRRSGASPLQELASLREIWNIYRTEKPALVHHVGLKPVIYGSIVASLLRSPGVVNALAGLGFVFSSHKIFARVLRPAVKLVFSLLLKRSGTRTIVQNESDFALLTEKVGIPSGHVRLVRGSGVDVFRYSDKAPSSQPPLVVLIGRMLSDKGVGDFVEAAARIRGMGLPARFALVGTPDPENPTSIPEQRLRAWHNSGTVEWWGYRADIPNVLEMASIACLPSFYGEGVPRALIEAMASCRAIVTTDIPGCRDLVVGGTNGVLVPPRDVDALSVALEKLILDPKLCIEMGVIGREIVAQSFSLDKVVDETLQIYSELVPAR